MDHEGFFRALRTAGASPRILAAVRRGLKSLGPPFPEVEVIAAHEARKVREANRMLAECLSKPPGTDTTPPDGKGGQSA
jgi:hypothetical protein